MGQMEESAKGPQDTNNREGQEAGIRDRTSWLVASKDIAKPE